MVDEGEREDAVAGEGTQPPAHFARTPLTRGKCCVGYPDAFATTGQGCYNLRIGWGGGVVRYGTGWECSIDSQLVICTSGGSHVVFEGGRSRVDEVLVGYSWEGLVVLMGSAGCSSEWSRSSGTV